MPSFDYITIKEFRESLEADYADMRRCAEIQAWKSVQVLAGSIIEALLVDYLTSTKNPVRPGKDPLKMDLAEVITICRSENVLSDRTSDLCSVVKSYRNLIHPGRMVRLGEQAPDKGSATIALALIDMITDDLVRILRTRAGLTGEQILSKIQRDANSLTILKHLLAEVSEPQRERLLIDLIPAAHQQGIDAENSGFGDERYLERAEQLESAYRTILETVPSEVRTRVALEFVRVLKEEDGERVLSYVKAFFKPSDIEFVPKENQAMVREHLLGNVTGVHNLATLAQVRGIAEYLEPSEVTKWLDPFIRTLVSSSPKEVVKDKVREQLLEEFLMTFWMPDDITAAVIDRLDIWIRHFVEKNDSDKEKILRQLKEDIEAAIPF